MFARKIRAVVLVASASLGLAACSTYDGYGYGGGYYRGGYALSDGGPFYGWYDNSYYPGSGHYIYDRRGHRRAMNQAERRHWLSRAHDREDRQQIRQNYREFRADQRGDRARFRAERQADREAFRSGQINREQFRSERRSDRRALRQERRSNLRELRRENRRAIRD
jgi:hypothetical protein